MNYAWSNPVTGLREQTLNEPLPYRPARLEALRQEAARRAWETLQSDETAQEQLGIGIFEQIRIGSITPASDYTDFSEVNQAQWNPAFYAFAFCHPITGARVTTGEWPSYLKDVLREDPVGFISEVVIYASRFVFTVRHDDPEPPPAMAPVEPTAREMGLDDLEALHQEVCNFIDLEGGNPAPKATALALIDIARSLRRLLGEFSPLTPDQFEAERIAGGESPVLEGPLCTCTGDGITADGVFCVCPAGMARKRAAAVANRAPTQEPALPAQPDKSLLCPHNTVRESCPFCNPKIAFYTAPLQKKDSGTVNEVSPDGPKREESGE